MIQLQIVLFSQMPTHVICLFEVTLWAPNHFVYEYNHISRNSNTRKTRSPYVGGGGGEK